MNAAAMKCLLISVTRLTLGQKAGLLATLDAGRHEQEVCSLVESRLIPTQACLRCNGTWIVRNGIASRLQRSKCRMGRMRRMRRTCRTCRHTFTVLSTTPLTQLRMKAKRLKQQELLVQGLSVHKSADALRGGRHDRGSSAWPRLTVSATSAGSARSTAPAKTDRNPLLCWPWQWGVTLRGVPLDAGAAPGQIAA